MAELTVTTCTLTGVAEPTPVAVDAAGDRFDNTGLTWIEIINSSGVNSYTVTVNAVKDDVSTGTDLDQTISVGTSATVAAGVYTPRIYSTDGAQEVTLNYTGTAPATDLTIAVFSAKDANN